MSAGTAERGQQVPAGTAEGGQQASAGMAEGRQQMSAGTTGGRRHMTTGMAGGRQQSSAGMVQGRQQMMTGTAGGRQQSSTGMVQGGQQMSAGTAGGRQQMAAGTAEGGQQSSTGTTEKGQQPVTQTDAEMKETESVPQMNKDIPDVTINGWRAGDKELANENDFSLESKDGGGTVEKPDEQSQANMQIQSICKACPFKRKNYDYGKRILMTFPSMRPFPAGIAKSCVRMELQDIGCLPVASWQLAGNRFLLHGYYCYRHLLFAQLENGSYVLGVPGVFSDKERRNAVRFGFDTFQAIGEPVATQGVFGYWLMDMQPAA